ncbi:MAG: hypothetical protein WC612_02630 [Bdellovibrionales bacterium]|jgi:hypothetical protein
MPNKSLTKPFTEIHDNTDALSALAMSHPVIGKVLKRKEHEASPRLIGDFISCAKSFLRGLTAENWHDNHSAYSYNEGVYKGFRIKVALSGGLNCGSLSTLSQNLTTNRKISDSVLIFNILDPILLAYRSNSYDVYRMGRNKFAPITQDKLNEVDTRNSAIASFLCHAIEVRPTLFSKASFINEVAQRCAYSAPGRITDYHASLATIVMRSPKAEGFVYQMSQLYAASENVLLGEDWGGHAQLSRELEKRFGATTLKKACPDCTLWQYAGSEPIKGMYGTPLGRQGINLITSPT